jgi:hypothetical protein
MSNVFLNIIIGLSAATVGVLAFVDEFGKKKKHFKVIKSIRFKIIVFIVATFFGIMASVKKDSKAEQQSANDKIEAQKEQLKKDSINKIFTVESNQKIASALIDALGKYHLKYDSAQKAIIKVVRDSLKEKIIIHETELPTITMAAQEGYGFDPSKDGKMFEITVVSVGAGSRNVNLFLSFVTSPDFINFNYEPSIRRDFCKNAAIAKNFENSILIPRDTNENYKYIIMWCRGTYMDNKKSLTFNYDQVTMFNNKSRTVKVITGQTEEKIKSIIIKAEK